MAEYVTPLERLIEQFQSLQGIGRKTAVRLAFSVLDFDEDHAREFADAVINAKKQIKKCSRCFNISENELCPVCEDDTRDRTTVCVVEDAKAVMAMERVKEYRGVYHVLHGTISPIDGRGPDQLYINELIERINSEDIKEIIIATNPTIDGETTAMYLARLIKPYNMKISRLAYGVPVGGDLEYADEMTLFRAIDGRKEM